LAGAAAPAKTASTTVNARKTCLIMTPDADGREASAAKSAV
jgi:hypothetical protein